ncbi:zinc finger and BTB domain-containing protein 49-like [Neocloeon triangulifer]|uniref:zinc finger and BTB domain-containing protein 49-like n=1 Tax=Neocloeon triangulifer TaxID=2078957 RepID=UPI00286F5E88|nr:zinc finger and BTB domain-containing protein 49-like [Neocloeon triangulifer]
MQAIAGPLAYLSCTDCKSRFSSASSLLKHFAEHILNNCGDGSTASSESDDTRSEIFNAMLESASPGRSSPSLEERRVRPKLPELLKIKRKRNSVEQQPEPKRDDESQKDEFNPLTFCVVTMEEGNEKLELQQQQQQQQTTTTISAVSKHEEALQAYKKYVCTYCNKRFGWSTDLKRHILTHTGERPFQCQLCGATFTRNFLLQKHVIKLHSNNQCVVPVAPTEPKKPPTSPGVLAVSPEPPSGAATEVRKEIKVELLDTAVPPTSKRRCIEVFADK